MKINISLLLMFVIFNSCNQQQTQNIDLLLGEYKTIKHSYVQPGNSVGIDDETSRPGINMSIVKENNKYFINSISIQFSAKFPIVFVSNNYFVIDTGWLSKQNMIVNGYGIVDGNKIKTHITGEYIPSVGFDDPRHGQPEYHYHFVSTDYYEKVSK